VAGTAGPDGNLGFTNPSVNQAYCGTLWGSTDLVTTFTGTIAFVTPIAPAAHLAEVVDLRYFWEKARAIFFQKLNDSVKA
jgi:hypothetical protein